MKQPGDGTTEPRSRRSLLAAAAGAATMTAATALARPFSAAADDGDPLILGQPNVAQTTTSLQGDLEVSGTLDSSTLLRATSGFGPAIFAAALNRGVEATSDEGTALIGTSLGMTGWTSSGVQGHASEAGGYGVTASNAHLETALYVIGKARLASRSGRATVGAGKSTVDVDLRQKGGLRGTPLCFANLMSYRPGVSVTTVRPNYPVAGKARIYLNRAVSANTFVAWFVLN